MKFVDKVKELICFFKSISGDETHLRKMNCEYSGIILIISDLEEIINVNRKVKFELDSPGAIRYNGYFKNIDLDETEKEMISDLFFIFDIYKKYSLDQIRNMDFCKKA